MFSSRPMSVWPHIWFMNIGGVPGHRYRTLAARLQSSRFIKEFGLVKYMVLQMLSKNYELMMYVPEMVKVFNVFRSAAVAEVG